MPTIPWKYDKGDYVWFVTVSAGDIAVVTVGLIKDCYMNGRAAWYTVETYLRSIYQINQGSIIRKREDGESLSIENAVPKQCSSSDVFKERYHEQIEVSYMLMRWLCRVLKSPNNAKQVKEEFDTWIDYGEWPSKN